MIKIRFITQKNVILGFDLQGHAGFAEHGQDIVCAAVSSAAYMVANTLTEIMDLTPEISVSEGKMSVKLNSDQALRASDLMQGFRLHLTELSEQYPNNITSLFTEV